MCIGTDWFMDLHIDIDRSSSATLPHQIGRAIIEMICNGTLPEGARLPASRLLAEQIGVARLTVVEAYQWLADQDYVSSRRGARTVVQDVRPLLGGGGGGASRPSPPRADDAAPQVKVIDFRAGRPDLGSFPVKLWMAAHTASIRALSPEALGYGDPFGYLPLRRALAAYLQRSRGLNVDPQRIAITTGSAQTVDLVLRALADHQEIVVEQPGHVIVKELVAIHKVLVSATPVDEEGLRTDLLSDDVRPRIVLVTPSHQFPTGCRMSLARRRDLISWADRTGATIIEDDYDSEFAYDGRPPVPLAKLDEAERVVYMGSFSKTLAPGLRLGFMVVPERLVAPISALKKWADYGGGVVPQAALASWIETGAFERHVQRMRAVYRRRYDLLVMELTARLGGAIQLSPARGGMHLMVRVRSERSGDDIVSRALRDGVVVYPLDEGEARARAGYVGLVLGFGSLSEREIVQGISVLARAVSGAP